MKRLLSLVLMLVLVLGTQTAFATTPTMPDPYVFKKYETINENNVSPEETFQFTIDPQDGAPALEGIEIKWVDGQSGGQFELNYSNWGLPTFPKVGIYEYIIKETAGNTAGVTYDDKSILLRITVTQEGDELVPHLSFRYGDEAVKGKGFTNEYRGGDLAITKKVTGNFGDQTQYFELTVVFKAEADKAYEQINVTVGSHEDNPTTVMPTVEGAEYKFYIKHGETLHFDNIPYGVSYTIVENQEDGYDAPLYNGDTESIAAKIMEPLAEVEITNNNDMEVDMGINLDNLPYIVMLILAAAGAAFMVIRRRVNQN